MSVRVKHQAHNMQHAGGNRGRGRGLHKQHMGWAGQVMISVLYPIVTAHHPPLGRDFRCCL